MSSMGEYIFTIILAAIFVSVFRSLLPGKSASAMAIRMISGIFLIVIAIKPLVNIRFGDTLVYFSDIQADASHIIASAQENTDLEIAGVIKEKAESYISHIALEYGAEIKVDLSIQNESPYLPEGVTIIGAVAPLVRQKISKVLETDFSIPEEAQIWTLDG